MRNNFQIVALQEKEFNNLFLMNEEVLKSIGAVKIIANKKSWISLQDKFEGCRGRRRGNFTELPIS